MTPERWKIIKEIFQVAIEKSSSERGAFLTRACAEDITLIPEIESLLDAYQHLAGFLEPKENPTIQLINAKPPSIKDKQ